MISVGQKLTLDFPLKVVRDGVVRETLLSELLTRPTIISVYMRNNTGSCDKQTDSLAAGVKELERGGFNVMALSRDTAVSHLKYAAKKGIAYALVSDPEDRFAKATDSLVEKSMYGRTFVGPARAAYVLATDGTVLAVIPKVDPANHAAQLLEIVRGL